MARGRFSVETFDGERGKLALELLSRGECVVVGNSVSLRRQGDDLLVEVSSAWHSIDAISKAIADAELSAAQGTVETLLTDLRVAAAVSDAKPVYELVIDYDTTTVLVATRRNDETKLEPRG